MHPSVGSYSKAAISGEIEVTEVRGLQVVGPE
jgi:hypothetical protein